LLQGTIAKPLPFRNGRVSNFILAAGAARTSSVLDQRWAVLATSISSLPAYNLIFKSRI
jgi:hypothetical protein